MLFQTAERTRLHDAPSPKHSARGAHVACSALPVHVSTHALTPGKKKKKKTLRNELKGEESGSDVMLIFYYMAMRVKIENQIKLKAST